MTKLTEPQDGSISTQPAAFQDSTPPLLGTSCSSGPWSASVLTGLRSRMLNPSSPAFPPGSQLAELGFSPQGLSLHGSSWGRASSSRPLKRPTVPPLSGKTVSWAFPKSLSTPAPFPQVHVKSVERRQVE